MVLNQVTTASTEPDLMALSCVTQVLAPWMLNEKLTRLDWIATGVICVGIVCATAFGSHCSYTYTLQQMVNLFEETIFIVST